MKQIINRILYDTDTATRIASDNYWERNTYLYKTPNGHYFQQRTTRWQGERDTIQALSQDEAMDLYEQLPEKDVEFEEAFGVKPEIG